MATFQDIVKAFQAYDLDHDGVVEIQVRNLSDRNPLFDRCSDLVDSTSKLVAVVVESRLFDAIDKSRYSPNDLLSHLLRYKDDLNQEGLDARFVEMTPYSGANRQDGKTLLAMREFFKAIRNAFSNFAGAVLVGSFPEAAIVRTWPQGTDEFSGQYRVGGPIGDFAGRRFEMVLADLDGNWRELYYPQVEVYSYVFNVTPSTTVSQVGTKVTLQNPQIEPEVHHLQDVFWIQDELCSVAGSKVELDMKCRDPEVGAVDKQQPNPVARPDICVSRINARSIAVQPSNVKAALDANGKPHATTEPIDYDYERWVRDGNLERTLLIDYFDRNHAFRSGKYAQQPFTIGLIESAHLGTYDAEQGLQGLESFALEKQVDATLLYLIKWLKKPAIFRVISAHAGCASTELLPESAADDVLAESEAGGHPWRWVNENGVYTPSFAGQTTADLMVFRTLWENKELSNLPPALLMHVGCSVNSVSHPEAPYNQPPYGTFQNAESLLFYANELAVLCHASDWNVGPIGFGSAFAAKTAVMGDGWKAISEVTSQDADLAKHSTQRKQNYIWGVVGDWTLQKYYAARPDRDYLVASSLAAARNANGWIVLVYTRPDHKIADVWQSNDGWARSVVIDRGSWAKQIAAASNADKRLEVFYIGSDNKIYHIWQTTPNGNWSQSCVLDNGSYAKQLVVGANADGRLEVIYIGSDNKLYHIWQTPGGWTQSFVLDNGSCAKQLVVGSNADKRLEVIYIGSDNKLYHIWQATPNGSWTPSYVLDNGSYAKQLAVGSNADKRLEVIYIGSDNKLYHIWQTPGGWTQSFVLDNGSYAKQLAVGLNADKRLEVIYIGSDNKLYHIWQATPNGSWTPSYVLDNGSYAKQLVVGSNADRRLEVFYIGSDDRIYHIWQNTPNGGWTGSFPLEG